LVCNIVHYALSIIIVNRETAAEHLGIARPACASLTEWDRDRLKCWVSDAGSRHYCLFLAESYLQAGHP